MSSSDEWSGTLIGGVLFDPTTRALQCFGEILPSAVTEAWSGKTKEQLVFEAEVFPYLVGFLAQPNPR